MDKLKEDSNFVTQTKFADIINKTRQHITNLKRDGKLILNDKGLVDVKKTLKNLEKLSDPAKKKTNFKNPQVSQKIPDKIPNEIIDKAKGDLTEEEIKNILENEDPSDFNQSKSRKEYFLSKSAQLNYLKDSELLMEKALVELQYFNISRLLRDKIFNIKYRISSQLSIMSNTTDISNLLDKEFRLIFNEITEELDKELKEIEDDYNKE